MRAIPRFSYETHDYHNVIIPNDWHVSLYEDDMDKTINCANCGKEIRYGNGFTSQEYHEQLFGFGYVVCEDCHNAELERRLREYDE